MSKLVVIPAIGGAQQSAVKAAFEARGWRVRGTVRKPEDRGADVALAELDDAASLRNAFEGADVVAFTLPQDHRPGAAQRIASAVTEAAGQAGVRRMVLNTAGTIDEAEDGGLGADLRAVRAIVQGGAAEAVVLQPTVFLENLLMPQSVTAVREQGLHIHPAPADAPISWISHRTLADFIVAAAEHDDAAGAEFRIGGPRALTNDQVAERLGERLGRDVRFQRLPPTDFAAALERFNPGAGERIASIYARLDREPDAMDVGDVAARQLGVTPEPFDDWAARQNWG